MENLRIARKEKGIKQNEIAQYLNINPKTYNRYENGKSQADYATLIKIANYLNTSVDYLLGRTENKERSQFEPTLDEFEENKKIAQRMGLYDRVPKLTNDEIFLKLEKVEELIMELKKNIKK